jgi:hypothetical protein
VSTQPRREMSIALPGRRRATPHARAGAALRAALGLALLLGAWGLRRVAAWLQGALPAIAAGVAAAIPVLRSTVHAVSIGWQPAGDDGIIVTRAWDVFTAHSPLVGQYSEAGNVTGHIVHSPGPLLYWLLALPARFGSVASIAGWMGAWNTLAIIGAVALARRRGGLGLMFATAAAIALMCQSLPSESFHDVWNPAAALFPFLLLVFLCWSLACGEYRLAPLSVLVASFVTQTHLTYLAPTLGMIAVVAGCLLAPRIRARRQASRAQRVGHERITALPVSAPTRAPEPSTPAAATPVALAQPRSSGLAAALAGDWEEIDEVVWPRREAPAKEPAVVVAAASASSTDIAGGTQRREAPPSSPGADIAEPGARAQTGGNRRGGAAGSRPRRPVRAWVLAAIAVAAICWVAPLVDEFEHGPGNLTLVVQTTEDRGATLGVGAGWNGVVRAVGVTPWWLFVPPSEWSRKSDVRASPGGGAEASAIVIIAALALIAAVGILRRRRELTVAALIGLVLCAALAANISQTPVTPLLAATIGYTAWWGSILGMWVWLVLGWALWLLGAHLASNYDGLRRSLARWSGRVSARRRRLALTLVVPLLCLMVVAETGFAVAATEKPDSHAHQYGPIAAIVARLDEVVPADVTLRFTLGARNTSTQPMEPAIRFGLVRHGDLPLSIGALARLGKHYELLQKRYSWYVLIGDGHRRLPHMTRVITVSFRDGFGYSSFSAWVARVGSRGGLERPSGVHPRTVAFGRHVV